MFTLLVLGVLAASGGARPAPLPITDQAVGPIGATTPLTTRNLERILPGARVEHFDAEGTGGLKDGGQGWRVWLNETELALTILSGADGTRSVNVLGPTPATPEGLRVGSKVDELAAGAPLHCRLSPEEDGEVLACARVRTPNVEFFFVPTDAEAAAAHAAGKRGVTGAVLQRDGKRTISMILWRPPAVKGG